MLRRLSRRLRLPLLVYAAAIGAVALSIAGDRQHPVPLSESLVPSAHAGIRLLGRAVNTCESSGCHGALKIVEQIHPFAEVRCVDCHGGDASQSAKGLAHVPRPASVGPFPLIAGEHKADKPPVEKRGPRAFRQGDPTNSEHNDPGIIAYRRFLNPGDLFAAPQSCGPSGCHPDVVERVSRSLHATMAGLMNGIYYANGHPGASAGRREDFAGDDTDKLSKLAVVLPRGEPLVDPNFDPSIPGTLRTLASEAPRNDEEQRNQKKSNPLAMATFFIQTDCGRCHLYTEGNKTPGTYHSTGCTACHVVYRNDGFSESVDPNIPKNETDHPFKHKIVRFAPTEQCAHCHNRGARHAQRFFGMRERPQGDNSSRILNEHGENTRGVDREILPEDNLQSGGRAGGFYPSAPLYLKSGDNFFGRPFPSDLALELTERLKQQGAKEASTVKGKSTQSIWRRDIRTNLGPSDNRNPFWIIDEDRTNDFDETPPDIHAERGMTCVDCHSKREMHGDGHLYTDRFHKIEIQCESCHGDALQLSNLKSRFGNPVRGLKRNTDGSVSLRLNSTGEIRPVTQIKEVIDSGRNANAQGPSHLLHGRLECYTCHAVWHDQCNSCHMIASYDTVRKEANQFAATIRDSFQCIDGANDGNSCRADSDCPGGSCQVCPDNKGCFFQRGHLDNVRRNAAQGQPRFVTTYDQLILGVNNKGRIQNFHTAGQSTLFANKLVGGRGSEAALNEGNFLEFSRCEGGSNDGGLCEVAADCPAGSCPDLRCIGGPFDGLTAQAEGQCKQCVAGSRTGELCSVSSDCGSGGSCEGGTLSRVCFGGDNDGQACSFDPNNPTDNPDCPGGSCGVRMFNFVFSTIDNGRHLPAMPLNPLFPHTVRRLPRNCDNCHLTPQLDNVDTVAKAVGLGTGRGPAVDPNAPGGRREVQLSRRVRLFTNGKGDLDITNPQTGLPIRNSEEFLVNIDQFIEFDLDVLDVNFQDDGKFQFRVRNYEQLRPTTHMNTGPLDAATIERVLNNPQNPQVPAEPRQRAERKVRLRADAYQGNLQ